MKSSLSLIMTDIPDWDYYLGPRFILGKDDKLYPVYIGKNIYDEKHTSVGIYIDSKNYENIDHNKIYVLIHAIEIDEDLLVCLKTDDLKKEIVNVDNPESVDRMHIHIGKQ